MFLAQNYFVVNFLIQNLIHRESKSFKISKENEVEKALALPYILIIKRGVNENFGPSLV